MNEKKEEVFQQENVLSNLPETDSLTPKPPELLQKLKWLRLLEDAIENI